MSKQFRTFGGFQETIYLAVPEHPYKSTSEKFIQLVNINNIHWVCVSNVLSSSGVVEVYDSKPNFSIGSSVLHEQVAKILRIEGKSFKLNHVDVQRQLGSNDCGLYAIANAVTLCFGGDPHSINYDQESFRVHLAKCFESQIITMFPVANNQRRLTRRRLLSTHNINVFCTCRLPWNKNDSKKGPLVQCKVCKEWYHELCMKINEDIISSLLKYVCKLCLNT